VSVLRRPPGLDLVKYDGYRLIVQREGKIMRLFSRNGNDWSGCYPWIAEALKNKHDRFVIDGEAVVLGGRPDCGRQRLALPQVRSRGPAL
jgi:ATP-dependent DNA ligase